MVSLLGSGPAFAAQQHSVSVSAWTLVDGTDDRGTLLNRSWELWQADGRGLPSKGWGSAYASSRYVEYLLPAVVPSGTVISSATLTHVYANQAPASTQAKLSVYDGATWTDHILTPASGTSWVTDSVQVPELTAPAKANAARIRLYGANEYGVGTTTDQLRLTIASNQGTFEVAPDRVDDRSDGVSQDRSPELALDDGSAYQTRDAWPTGAFMADRYIEFAIGPVVAPGSVIESVRIDVTRSNQRNRMSLVARLDVFDGANWTSHALSPDQDTQPVSDSVVAPEISDAGKLERMRIRFLAYSPNGQTGKTRHDRLTVTVAYRTPEWSFQTGAATLGNPAAHPITGALYGGSNDGVVRSMAFASGSKRWELPTGGPIQNQTVARVDGQVRMFAGSQDGYLYAADDAGTRLWAVPVAGDYDAATKTFAAPVAQDHVQGGVAYRSQAKVGAQQVKNALFVGTYNSPAADNAFYAIDAANGSVLWRDERAAGEFINCYPAVDWSTDRVVYSTYAGRVLAVETSGVPAWERALGAAISGSPTLWNGRVLVGTSDGKLHVLRLSDGSTERVVQPAAGAYTMGTPWPGAVTYISSSKGSVYAVETSTGAVLAEGSGLDWPRLPVVYDTKVYVGTNSGLYALDKTTLAKVGTYRVGYAVSSPALDVATARLFFGDSSGRYTAIGMNDFGPPAATPAAQPSGAALAAAVSADQGVEAAATAAQATRKASATRGSRSARVTRAKRAGRGARPAKKAASSKVRTRVRTRPVVRQPAALSVKARGDSMVISVTPRISMAGDQPYRVTLFGPDGGVYAQWDGTVTLSRKRGRGPIIVWQVPVAGTWAAGLPGRWTAAGTLSGKGLSPGSDTVD